MVSRKRTRSDNNDNGAPVQHHQDESPDQQQPQQFEEHGLLKRLRDCWEFANLMQFIQIFGQIFKIDENFDIETLEEECLKPGFSERLLDIGLRLLKFISSRRDLTYDNFDEQTRRQYNRRAPHVQNPFGYDEEPLKFSEFDIFLKLRVLNQLTVWTFANPDNIRRRMPELSELEQTEWRVEEMGYDRKGRSYYVLDDNRLYRRTDPPLPSKPVKSRPVAKSARAMRASKRRKLSGAAAFYGDSDEDNDEYDEEADAYTGEFEWECVAVTLAEYRQFVDSIRKTKDPNEKILRDSLLEHTLPFMESIEEGQERKKAKRDKELLNLQLLAGAKRSSRIASKADRERHEREEIEAIRRQEAESAAAAKEQEKQRKMEEERDARIMSRERRMKDRELKRQQHEAELERIAEEQRKLERGEGRASERYLQAELAKQKKSLQDLSNDDHWVFDCSGCGVHGENLDDGSHSVACEKCSVWQHSKCLGIAQDEAEREDFQFVCKDCKRREEEARLPKLPPLKFRLGASPSPAGDTVDANGQEEGGDRQQHAAPSPVKVEKQGAHLNSVTPQTDLPSFVPRPQPSSEPRPLTAHSQLPFHRHVPPSPSKSANGPASFVGRPRTLSFNHNPLPPDQQTSPHGNRPLDSQRPSSSQSAKNPSLPSPIHNRPSMSPTQGNRDVGPLAGLSSTATPDDSIPWTPFGQRQAALTDPSTRPSSSSAQNGHPFGTPSTTFASHSSPPPQNPQSVPLSGISPTKHSPRHVASHGLAGAPVMPPVRKLEPSPKLMGRSSPDAPIPPPMKSMSPEQEERRQRENAILQAETEPRAPSQFAKFSSSPLDVPLLGPSVVSQQQQPAPMPPAPVSSAASQQQPAPMPPSENEPR